MTTLEVCCADIDSVQAAIDGGAQRIELCTALETGGLTPSFGLIRQARFKTALAGVKLHVLIRERPGDYIYSDDELNTMADDIVIAGELGCDGVVIGALNDDGTVDAHAIETMLEDAGDISVTFHRAFDLCRDPFEALDTLARIPKINRILTSGLAPSAPEGADLLRQLMEKAPEGITILAGAGVNSANVADLVRSTGVTEVHASAKSRIPSAMTFRRGDVSMSAPGADEYSRYATSADEVKAIVNSLTSL